MLRSFSGSSFSETPPDGRPSLDYAGSATETPSGKGAAGHVKEETEEGPVAKRPRPSQSLRRANALRSTEFGTPSPSPAPLEKPATDTVKEAVETGKGKGFSAPAPRPGVCKDTL